MIVRSTRVCVSSVGEIIIQRSSSFVDRWRMKKKRDEQKGTFELHQNALGMTCIIDPPSTNAPEVSSRFSCKCTVRTWGLRSVAKCAKKNESSTTKKISLVSFWENVSNICVQRHLKSWESSRRYNIDQIRPWASNWTTNVSSWII